MWVAIILAHAQTEPKGVSMKPYIVIRNGHGIVAEGDSLEALEAAYEEAARRATDRHMHLPDFSLLEFCHLEKEDGKLCILDTRENSSAAESYYNVGFEF
jgi:hypothetical protein